MVTVTSSDPPHNRDPAPDVVQLYGTVTSSAPLGLSIAVREEVVARLNQMLADTTTMRDLYRRAHWQVCGPAAYPLHRLFDVHHGEQCVLVDVIAQRVEILGGVAIAMAFDVAETSTVARPPRGREKPAGHLTRLLSAHGLLIAQARAAAHAVAGLGDDGTHGLLVNCLLRTHERQVWRLSEHSGPPWAETTTALHGSHSTEGPA